MGVNLPAGTYWIGDPCYVIRDAAWTDLLAQTDYLSEPVGTVNGKPVVALATLHGDGEYMDQDGVLYGVDSGTIGIVPVELIAEVPANDGRVVEFPHGLLVGDGGGDGLLCFGHIHIDTSKFSDESYDEEDGE